MCLAHSKSVLTEESRMRISHLWRSIAVSACAVAVIVAGALLMPSGATFAADDSPEVIAEGKKLAFDRKKGNCLACHAIDDGTLPGNGGPPIVAMKARFPDRAKLRAQIWDSTEKNPSSLMPPFGRHGILTAEEVDKITAYIHSL